MFKYTPLYSNGKEPDIEENDIYRIKILYVPLFSLESDTTQENTDTTQENEKTTQKNIETTQKILMCIKNDAYISRQKLAEKCGITPDGIKWQLKQMQQQNLIRRVGPRQRRLLENSGKRIRFTDTNKRVADGHKSISKFAVIFFEISKK